MTTTNTVDLSHAGVDTILAALALAGQYVHYNETDGDTFLDVWLTDLDDTAATILSWRDNGEGWLLRTFSGDSNDTSDRKWPITAGSPAEVARDVTSILADTEPTAQATPEQAWYFTFGSGQQHDGKYVVIPGTYDEARNEMLRHFGNAWSFQYASPERAGVEQFGMVELPRSEWPPTDDELADEIDEIDEAFAEETTAHPEPDPRQVAWQLVINGVASGLPIPAAVEIPGHYDLVTIRLPRNDTAATDAWASYLSLPEPRFDAEPLETGVRNYGVTMEGFPTVSGWHISVQCFCTEDGTR